MSNENLETRTLATYNNGLNKIKELGINIDNIVIDDLLTLFKEKNIPLASQNLYLSSINWHLKKNVKNEEIIKKISKEINVIRKKIDTKYKENKYSDKEIENCTSWNTIVEIYEDLKKKFNTNNDKKTYDDLILLSLYILHPPRRTDYYNMYINNIELKISPKKILWTSNENVKKYGKMYSPNTEDEIFKQISERTYKNYYISTKYGGFFIFDDYKTFKNHGKQVVEVLPELDEIITKYIEINNLKEGDKLFDLEWHNYTYRLKNIFKKYINKSISVNMIRHIFISNILNTSTPPSDNERIKISYLMGHSMESQMMYRKENNNIGKDIINSNNYKVQNKYKTDEDRKEGKKYIRRKSYHKNKQIKKQKSENNTPI